MIAARRSQCHIQRVSEIFGTNITAQLPLMMQREKSSSTLD